VPKAPPATSPENLEEKRKACITLAITRWTVWAKETRRWNDLEFDHVLFLTNEIMNDLEHHECWGEFKP